MQKPLGFLTLGFLGLLLTGCSQLTEQTTTTTTTVTTTTTTTTTSSTSTTLSAYKLDIRGKLASGMTGQGAKGLAITGFGSSEGGASYEDRYVTPSSYEVGVARAKLLKSDGSSFEVFNQGGVNNYQSFELTAAQSAVFGSSETYPAAGSYEAVRLTVAYLKMKLKMNLGTLDNFQYRDHDARIWASTVTKEGITYSKKDIQVYHENAWYWINLADWSFSLTRPATTAAQGLDLIAGDPGVATVSFTSPLVIPAQPSGLYSGVITFNITNTFFFDDVDGDNKFEPVVPSPSGDWGGYFWPLMPTLSLSFESLAN